MSGSYQSLARSALVGAVALVSLGARADAQSPDGPRTLGGHAYVPSTLVEWPFIVSRVASTTAVGFAELEIRPSRLSRLLEADGTDEFVYADQSVLASVAVTRWLSLAVRAQGSLIIPLGRDGAVFVGAQGMYGGNATAALRLIRTDRTQVTALFDAGRRWPNSVVPARLPRSPLERGDFSSLRPGLAIACTLSPRLGLQASASYAWQQLDIVEEDTFRTLAAGAAVTYAMRAMPLTLLLGAQYAHMFGESEGVEAIDIVFGVDDSNAWAEAGVVLHGIAELDLGAAFDWRLDELDDEARWFGQLRLAYYFL